MKVILLKTVPKVGAQYEVKEVATGYARNVLFRQNWALPGTPENIKKALKLQAEKVAQHASEEMLADKIAESLNGVTITISAKASPEGHLFGSLSAEEIVTAIKAQKNFSLAPSALELSRPIKTTGLHNLNARLTGGREVSFLVLVSAL